MTHEFPIDLEYYQTHGWLKFSFDPKVELWAERCLPIAQRCVADAANKHWWRYQETWFVGVNVLPNNRFGTLSDGTPLQGGAVDFISAHLNTNMDDLDAAQISVIKAGYPKPNVSTKEYGFEFRKKRDAAHVDGLLRQGNDGFRFAAEHHQYILAIPLNSVRPGASPLVVWSGSHKLIRAQLLKLLGKHATHQWPQIPVDSIYNDTRQLVFSSCERKEIPLNPGEALLLDRHMLHGTAPWKASPESSSNERVLAFFRPQFDNAADWLSESQSLG